MQKPIEGDLMELYEERVKELGKKKADRKFIKDVLLLFRKDIIRPAEGSIKLNYYGMLKNYFKVGIRNILKYKTFSFINIFGLAVAMSVGMLIILMMSNQDKADQFHPNKERIYRVLTQKEGEGLLRATSPLPLAEQLMNYASVETATQLVRSIGGDIENHDLKKSTEARGFFADEHFFDVFGFKLEEGSEASALAEPRSMVISKAVAERLFKAGDAIGQSIQFKERGLDGIAVDFGISLGKEAEDWGQYIITGIIDLSKYPTHIKFDALISTSTLPQLDHLTDHQKSWASNSRSYTYVLMADGSSDSELQAHLNDITIEKEELLNEQSFATQAMESINVGRFLANPITLRLPIEGYYVLVILALVVMISACLNYTNLSIARALTRAKEIGVRKVNGATKKQIFLQFMIESVLISLIALLVANAVLFLLKPMIQSLWAIQALSPDLAIGLPIITQFVVFAMVVGVFAGLYPAARLSRFTPVRILKGNFNSGSKKLGLKAALNVAQFVFSLFFIITAIVIVRQFDHYLAADYGMQTDNIVNVPLQGNDYEIMMAELGSVPGVENISACYLIPAMPNSSGTPYSVTGAEDEDWYPSEFMSVNPSFIETLELSLVAGKNIDKESEGRNELVINEYAAHLMGYENPNDAVNQTLFLHGQKDPWKVIGVIQDFKFQSMIMGEGDLSLLMRFDPSQFNYLNVKIAGNNPLKVVQLLDEKWESVDPVHDMQAYFYNESLSKSIQWMGDLGSIIGYFAFLAILISCLGLLGMAVYTTERRVKEVGIRKVLGAGSTQLALLLSKSFLILLGIAILIAAPLSYFANKLWIANIPNQAPFGVGVVLLGSLIMLVLGLLTIGSQVFKVTKSNPVESLKYE
ncbi:ABC transporter permease [Ekhidna sp.]|uniref:ABC transporter permease n=1 Tax=Ekhidna sp. TaxID=2608089 RepID=UPI003B59DD1B